MIRNKFSLSHHKLATCNMGQLVPVGLTEVLPGDSIQHATSLLMRVSPLLAPVMHPVDVRIHHWFVPFRLVWEDWEEFITGGPGGTSEPTFPTIDVDGAAVGSLADYLGVPVPVTAARPVSALPFRCYNLIFNENYRDEDIIGELANSLASGVDGTTNQLIQRIAWEKDYFTTSRETPQKGDDVTLPIGTSAPVTRVSNASSWQAYNSGTNTESTPGAIDYGGVGDHVRVSGAPASFDPNGGLVADLSLATAATINQLREAFAVQKYQEARSRYGSRYTEYLAYLGIRSSDARLQRPEYLGGGRQVIQFSEVLQTGVTTDGDDAEGVGNLKGHGIAALRSNRYRRFFEEHGYVMSLLSVRPKTIYASGLPRHWNRRTKFDFFQREFQHIGQQEVLNKELRLMHATPDGVFGYQDRYDDLRRMESSISGEFRTTLNFWHMARIFGSDPALNSTFITADPTDRIYASTATHQLLVMARHSMQARRILAPHGTPMGV